MPDNKPHGEVRRRRKRQAAYVRHRCAYCRRRFPLSIALLIAARHPVHEPDPPFTAGGPTVHGGPVVFTVNGSGVHGGPVVNTDRAGVFTAPLTLDVWRLLARLAHANQPTHNTPSGRPRSTPCLHESTPHSPTPDPIPEREAA
ncbi:hypothetical protein ACWD5R_36955 [Streptomyces sp. NPDC002514]|uniref:hypothetical protein n=1 Tax=Streptomyces sp. NPDC001270 TaxID=3364554 RepID=UPI0036A9F21C